jgi:hypothetical protein
MLLTIATCIALAALPGAVGVAAESDPSPEDLVEAHLRCVLDGDWAAARDLWLPSDLATAGRLGIRYRGQPFKLDSASPLTLERERLRAGEVRAPVGEAVVEGETARIPVRLRGGGQEGSFTYFAVRTDGGWRLASPATAVAAGWPRRESEFLELRIQPPLRIAGEAVRRLDRFVARACERLEVPPERIDLLRREKLGYILADEETVARIVGAPTRGAALLQTDDVVTGEPCHLHELAHLLINVALRDLPLFTLPFLQEGTAVALGGRWGRGPEVMRGLGKFTLEGGLLAVDDLLTWNDFHGNAPDLTYAPSGVLAGFLLGRLGGERFRDLYRDLSGDLDDLAGLDRAAVRERLCAAAGEDWPRLQEELDRHVGRLSCGGILTGAAGSGEPLAELARDGLAVTITDDGEWTRWVVEAGSGRAAGAVLLVGPDAGEPARTSRLFAEQFPGRTFAGELAALVFSPEEVGLYDFRTDLLVAKYVASFCPGRPVASEGGRRLVFALRAELLPDGPWEAVLASGAR